ncbi:hypothetical protein PL18_15520 [Vibrio renipiscarius]|uniref:Uncharacterized protein n=1 Tax=Vibrio renipiscarius TaxID=1461322 RepID=A0A0C2K8L2_9VIBR|nr:hypothetical protein PL18_15520 [Vibrio renipiscarius]KII78378.1 hypothetical protein OJ16_10155 [Vibrio renipiscarius]
MLVFRIDLAITSSVEINSHGNDSESASMRGQALSSSLTIWKAKILYGFCNLMDRFKAVHCDAESSSNENNIKRIKQ